MQPFEVLNIVCDEKKGQDAKVPVHRAIDVFMTGMTIASVAMNGKWPFAPDKLKHTMIQNIRSRKPPMQVIHDVALHGDAHEFRIEVLAAVIRADIAVISGEIVLIFSKARFQADRRAGRREVGIIVIGDGYALVRQIAVHGDCGRRGGRHGDAKPEGVGENERFQRITHY